MYVYIGLDWLMRAPPPLCPPPRGKGHGKAFWIFHGPKRVTTGSNRAKNTCLSIPSGLGTTLEKLFSSPWKTGKLLDPPLAPTMRPGLPSSSTK